MKLAKFNNKAEIFYTIQGEGKSSGMPCVFIRASLCNLHCIWCDTDYTWNWEGTPFKTTANKKFTKKDFIIELPPQDAVKTIRAFPCKHVVLTGGEPLMQQEALLELMMLLKSHDPDYFIEIETNGTLLPKASFDKLIDQYNVSPKLANSNNEVKIRERAQVLNFFSLNPKATFKFVISRKEDLKEVLDLSNKYGIGPSKIYLMPEGTKAADLNKKQIWLVEMCKKFGFNYTDRLHIHLYGAQRGV